MSEEKRAFITKFFTDLDSNEDIICVYDRNYIPRAREATFNIKTAENSPMIACKIHINNKTGEVLDVKLGIKPGSEELYKPEEIRDIVNSTEFTRTKLENERKDSSNIHDYGRSHDVQIISTTMTNYTNRSKLRFIPPSKRSGGVDSMSKCVDNYIKKELDPSVTDVQYFQWGTLGHVGVIAIDPNKFRQCEVGSVAFFDYGCMFTDSFKDPPQLALMRDSDGNVALNESSLSFRIVAEIEKQKRQEENRLDSLLAQQNRNVHMIFGELANLIKKPYLPQNFSVIYEKQIGQLAGETDFSYNVEVLHSEIIRKELNTLEKFDKFCRTIFSMEDIRNKEFELEKSAHKTAELGL